MTWDGSVAVATGSAYEGEALALPGSAPTGEAVSLTLTVDGTAVSQPAVLVNGNYYLAEGFLAQLGAESALVERLGHHRRVPVFLSKGPRLGRGPFLAYFTGLRQSFEQSLPFIRPSCPIFLWPL